MEKHSAESYFVIGEGLLRRAPEAGTRAWLPPPLRTRRRRRFASRGWDRRGSTASSASPNRKKIANAMASGRRPASQIPAGFTYLGQFIDHDLTFDRTSVMLGANVSPAAAAAGAARRASTSTRSTAPGRRIPESAKFYEADGLHLKMGKTVAAGGIPAKDGFDLPRGAGQHGRRRSARRSSPTRATTRTSRSPRRTSRSSASTTAWSTPCRRRCHPARRSRRHASS